jgi:MFS family permease
MPPVLSQSTETTPDAAGSLLRVPRFRRLLYAQGCFGVAYSAFMILPKYLATRFGAGPAQIGWIMASAAVAPVLVAPVMGTLCRRLGAGRTMAFACGVMAVGAATFVGVDEAGPLAFLCRGLQGLAWGLVFSSASLLVLELAGTRRLGEGLALHGSANLISSAVGPALAEPALVRWDAAPVFGTAALVALVAVWLSLRIGGGRPAPGPVPPLAQQAPPTGQSLLPSLPWPVLGASAVLGIGCGVMLVFHQPLALSRGLTRVSDFLVAYTVGAVAVRLGAGRLPDRIGVGKVAVASFFLYGLVVAAMALLNSPLRLVLLGLAFGVAHGLFWPSFLSLAVSRQPAGGRPRLLAYVNATFSAGVASVGLLGQVAEGPGFGVLFVGVGALVVLSAACLRYTVHLLGGRSATPTCPK